MLTWKNEREVLVRGSLIEWRATNFPILKEAFFICKEINKLHFSLMTLEMDDELRIERTSFGIVSGPYAKEVLVCQQSRMVRPMSGVMHGEDPLGFTLPVMFLQITLIFLSTRIIYFMLKPFRQSYISAQILAGITLGPSFLWHYFPPTKNMFPPEARVNLHIIAYTGLIFHLFIQTLQMDTNIIRKASGKAMLIGFMTMMVPITVGLLSYKAIHQVMKIDTLVSDSIPRVIVITSLSAFPVITSLLSDLKILNSELGRLAAHVSMISDISTFLLAQIMPVFVMHRSLRMALMSVMSSLTLFLMIVFIVRPLIIWLTRCTKQGEPMQECHFLLILLIVLLSSLISEVFGQHYGFGPIILGIVLPDGPPLGAELEQKLNTFCNGLLVPVFCAISGLNMNVFTSEDGKFQWIIISIIIITYIAKLTGTILPALCCGMPFLDALCLALIMCCKGVIEVAMSCSWKDSKMLDNQSFSCIIITMLAVTGVARPVISYLYDPSKRYTTSNRRTILGSNYDTHVRMLVCINNADNVPMIINLLKACNPARFSPITVFVLHLMKLTGHAAAILIPHHPSEKLKINGYSSEHTVKAFDALEKLHQGGIVVQHYTAVAPYKSMHSDICTIAHDKRTTIVILPFHKQWSIDGKVGSIDPSIRHVNRSVLDNAPCSVGVLIDRGQKSGSWTIKNNNSMCSIAVLLLGGDDDWEALAFSRRVAEHPQVNLTVVLFKHYSYHPAKEMNTELLINKLYSSGCEDRICLEEVTIRDGEEMIQQIRSLEDNLDLVIVGRDHDTNSPLAFGLTEWSECPELGVFGDMLSSSDFQCSVLVVSQQPLPELTNDSVKPFSTSTSMNSRELSDDEECRPMKESKKDYQQEKSSL